MNKIKKVLIISPLDPKKPGKLKFLMGGENTFTKNLLKYPPPGFKYYYFEQALIHKMISLHPLTWLLLYIQKLRILPPGPRALIFRSHFNFDLIYAHVYPIKIINNSAPVILSDSSSNKVFLKQYLHWPDFRINFCLHIKKFIFSFLGIADSESNPGLAKKIIVFSGWAKKIKKDLGINSMVLYPGLPSPKLKRKKTGKITRILFAGVWFERKGGRILLRVFRKLIHKYPNIRLSVLAPLPSDIKIFAHEPIAQKNFVSYAKLKKYYRSHDILVHIPPKVEGYGMVVTEAMSYRMAVIVSRICVLPEFIKHLQSGLVIQPDSEPALEKALIRLVTDVQLREKLGVKAQERFQQIFSIAVFQKHLGKIFNEVLSHKPV